MILLRRHGDTTAALAGVLLAIAILVRTDAFSVAAGAIFIAAIYLWIAWQDARTFTIPDGALVAMALVGAVSRIVASDNMASISMEIVVDILACGGALFVVREAYYRMKGFDGLGFGDVKLAAAGGVLIGTVPFSHALLVASLLGLCAMGIKARQGRDLAVEKLPFGTLLAPACAAFFLVGAAGW